MDRPPLSRPSGQSIAIQTLAVDATTAEVLRAFERAGCRSILLKGLTFQRELYRDGTRRVYGDADLLVAPSDLERAEAILTELRFELVFDHRLHTGGAMMEPHALEWSRPPEGKTVDLHWRLPGVEEPPERAWELLAARTEPITLGGAPGEALDAPGMALLVALHAAQHGRALEKPLTDLARALEHVDRTTWTEASRLAVALDATEAFAAGLRLDPAGERLAAELQLPAVHSARRRLQTTTQPPGAFGILRMLELPTPRARVRALRRELIPSRALIRSTSALGRRGHVGLALAYVTRILIRLWRLPAAIRAARWSRRSEPRG